MRYRTTISIVRKVFVCSVFLLAAPLLAQSFYSRHQFLDKLTSSAADVQDDIILKRTLYGTLKPDDISLEDAQVMLDAAKRRADRVSEKIAEVKPLIEQGILARNELKPLEEELEFRQKTLELAEGRSKFLHELAEMARVEQSAEQDDGPKPIQERFDGNGRFDSLLMKKIVFAYERQFAHAMPISANGETAVHKAMGFDHRGRVDVALQPDSPEGVWLRRFLEQEQIPYYAFRAAVAGRATAAHIHIGPPSTKLRVAD